MSQRTNIETSAKANARPDGPQLLPVPPVQTQQTSPPTQLPDWQPSAENYQVDPQNPLASLYGHGSIAKMPLQTKLTVGDPEDPYEQEADRVAAQVMTIPDPALSVQHSSEESVNQLNQLSDAVQQPSQDQSAAVIQRTLADVDPTQIKDLEDTFKNTFEKEKPKLKAYSNVATTAFMAIAKKVIDLANDSPLVTSWITTIAIPKCIQQVPDTTVPSLDEFKTSLKKIILEPWLETILKAVSETGEKLTKEKVKGGLEDAEKALEFVQSESSGEEVKLALQEWAVPEQVVGTLSPYYAALQQLGTIGKTVIEELRKALGLESKSETSSASKEVLSGEALEKFIEKHVLDRLLSENLTSLGNPGMEGLLKIFKQQPVKQVANTLLSATALDKRMTAGQIAILLGHRYGFGFSLDQSQSDLTPILGALNELPKEDVDQPSKNPWIKSFTVSMNNAKVDATGGSYSYWDKAIWIKGDRPPEKVAEAVRHEVGHAVDERMGWSQNKEYEKPEYGSWKVYDAKNAQELIEELIDKKNSVVKSWTGEVKAWAIETLQLSVKQPIFADSIKQDLEQKKLTPLERSQSQDYVNQLLQDPVYISLRKLRYGDDWNSENGGGEQIGQRIYRKNKTYDQWVSYEASARQTKVSNYQFFAPAEWFAELYAYYYATKPPGGAINETAKNTIESLLGIQKNKN